MTSHSCLVSRGTFLWSSWPVFIKWHFWFFLVKKRRILNNPFWISWLNEIPLSTFGSHGWMRFYWTLLNLFFSLPVNDYMEWRSNRIRFIVNGNLFYSMFVVTALEVGLKLLLISWWFLEHFSRLCLCSILMILQNFTKKARQDKTRKEKKRNCFIFTRKRWYSE